MNWGVNARLARPRPEDRIVEMMAPEARKITGSTNDGNYAVFTSKKALRASFALR